MRETLIIYLNDKPKRLYSGLKVKNAIGPVKARAVRGHRLIVQDGNGNGIDLDGALHEGQRLYTAPMDPTTFADQVQKQAG